MQGMGSPPRRFKRYVHWLGPPVRLPTDKANDQVCLHQTIAWQSATYELVRLECILIARQDRAPVGFPVNHIHEGY
jgi:hypothetical protein